jgi:uncharacterized membrane protein YhfC
MIANIVFSAMINMGAAGEILSGAKGVQLFMQFQALHATPSYTFMISGIERMFALMIHISLSVIVFYSVYENRRLWLYRQQSFCAHCSTFPMRCHLWAY